ncbi:MAG TPA: glycosyltransferase family 39 protein, partial [Bacteroidales bacterium]|nr:glycosyltransferase family 39 protein [Bacteroidales bacterium]
MNGKKKFHLFLITINNAKLLTRLYLIIICLLTSIIYYPITKYNFQRQWDDAPQVSENNDIKNLSFNKVKKIFSSTYVGMYQPLTTLTYSIEYFFSKDKTSASIYHTTNIILHLINIFLVFEFLFLLTPKNRISSSIGATFFALHPLNVETVAWISTRSNLLLVLFILFTLIFYLKYSLKNKKGYYWLSIVFFILALLSKSQAIVLPLLLILFDNYLKKDNKKNIWNKLP